MSSAEGMVICEGSYDYEIKNCSGDGNRCFDVYSSSVVICRKEADMFFGKKDKDVRLTDSQYKDLLSHMNKMERKEFDRKQEQLRRDREDDSLMGWLCLEDELDDI